MTTSGDFRHWSTILLFVGAALGFIAPLVLYNFWPAGNGLDLVGHQIGRDFLNTWAGPQLAFGGKINIIYDFWPYAKAATALFSPHLHAQYNFSYPPSALALFWPLGTMPYFPALAVWIVGTFTAFAAVTMSQVPRHSRWLALGLLAVAPACLINAMSGQNGFLSGALLIGALLLLDRRPIVAGVLLGLLTYKPHLGLVVAFVVLALRCWRTIGAAAATTLLLVGFSLLRFGVEPWIEYLSTTRQLQLTLLMEWKSLYAFMMPTWLGAMRSIGIPYDAAMSVQGLITIVVIAASCWAVQQTQDAAKRILVVAAATPLALPYAFNYDLTALAACVVWIVAGRIDVPSQWRFAVLLAWLAPLLTMSYGLQPLGIAPASITALFVLSLLLAARDNPRSIGSRLVPFLRPV